MAVDQVCQVAGPEGLSPEHRDLVREEPLLITLNDRPVTTLMCSPGDEILLALGYLYTEGIIASGAEVGAIAFCPEFPAGNVVRVFPAGASDWESRLSAHRTVFSSCGICGSEVIRSVASGIKPFDRPTGRLSRRVICELAEWMSSRQTVFKRTGGIHAAALVRVRGGRPAADTLIVKEDVGRHNALDKAVGCAIQTGLDLRECLLMLSGRLSFEMVAKAARAGVSDVAAVGAPTTLAVETAAQLNMFLAGFVRGESATVYVGAAALAPEA